MKKTAIILLSGGLDSTVCLAVAADQGFACHALSFDYGQKQRSELAAAARIAECYGAVHQVIPIALPLTGSALTDAAISVPSEQHTEGTPVTYVPARNTLFLAYALSYADMHQSRDIFIGANALDTPAYPDCRPDYLTAFETMANLAVPPSAANEPAIRIQAPVLYLDKSAVITLGQELNVDFSQTISCYQATDAGLACGVCASCGQRRRGFERAGLADPTRYQRS